MTMLFITGLYPCIALIIILFLSHPTSSQECQSQCPPITDTGKLVSSLCENDSVSTAQSSVNYPICHPTLTSTPSSIQLSNFRQAGHVTVIANYYTGCEAGRRESGVFAHVAQRWNDAYPNVNFVTSLKGGGDCSYWSNTFQTDATDLYPESDLVPTTMPLTIDDDASQIEDYYFTSPYPHPSYVILDENLVVKNKIVGPCCGYERYSECEPSTARELDATLSEIITEILESYGETIAPVTGSPTGAPIMGTVAPTTSAPTTLEPTPIPTTEDEIGCNVDEFTEWSSCSTTCGPGVQFRWRIVSSKANNYSGNCPSPVETRSCENTTPCESQCVPEFGPEPSLRVVEGNLSSPRDVAFHPTPGYHLGSYSEGRPFEHDINGEEAWVVNGNNHSVSIIVNSHNPEKQTVLSRQDRGYYHYMINATALSFNTIADSGRSESQDTFNYWAVCNNNRNTYMDTKEANFFMGPTLYDSNPANLNLVNRAGKECGRNEPCYFLHSDMLHESPACIGIAHDPELRTGYGTVYWAFDTSGDLKTGQLVRFDFRQPHGPGSMDHSTAAVRRFPEMKLNKGDLNTVHAGMVVHPTNRILYVVSPEEGIIWAVGADTGKYSRTARDEYPIYSNKLPSFEYSIYECVQRRVFADNLESPTGLSLSNDGTKIFVAESGTSKIKIFEVESGALLNEMATGYENIRGMAISPITNKIHFVDAERNVLVAVEPSGACSEENEPGLTSRVSKSFLDEQENAREVLEGLNGEGYFALDKDYECVVNPNIPNSTLFEQVHTTSGYASNDTNVQADAGMDANAALLANRTDCGATSDLNFDALLLGGFYCHECLPVNNGSSCDVGGRCTNLQWDGFVCDNEYRVSINENNNDDASTDIAVKDSFGEIVKDDKIMVEQGVTYRFTVDSTDKAVTIFEDAGLTVPYRLPGNVLGSAVDGPLILAVDGSTPENLYMSSSSTSKKPMKITVLKAINEEKEEKKEEKKNEEVELEKEENDKDKNSDVKDPSTAFKTSIVSSCSLMILLQMMMVAY